MIMPQSNRSYALAIGSLMLIALCAALFAFSPRPGGDSYSICLNKKLLFQQYVHMDASVKTIRLSDAAPNDVLNVKYSHCGRNGNDRNISIKDSSDKTLKEWHFADIAEKTPAEMSCKVKEILTLRKIHKGKLNLVYSSRELPEGRILASIGTSDEVKASLK
jgi:hypothetical protein